MPLALGFVQLLAISSEVVIRSIVFGQAQRAHGEISVFRRSQSVCEVALKFCFLHLIYCVYWGLSVPSRKGWARVVGRSPS